MSEREAIVAWLREEALSMPARGFWWAVLHPYKFGRYYGRFTGLLQAASSLERGDHLKGE